MIEIIPFNRSIFDSFSIETKKLTRYAYINNIELISSLLSMDLPIANKKIALRNIFDFLTYVDIQISQLEKTVIPISQATLIGFFKRDSYTKYMKILKDLGVITRVPYKEDNAFYKIGSKYCQYRVHSQYLLEEDLAIIVIEDDRKAKSIFHNEIECLDRRYINSIKNIDVLLQPAIEAEIANFKEKGLSIAALRSRISRILYTRRKRFIKKGKKVDRIYHSFTNLSKVARRHLSVPMNDIDIINCQPLLLAALLRKESMEFDSSYLIDCESGCFYERFADLVDPNIISHDERRSSAKISLYRNIFFGFFDSNPFNMRFRELYPNTWQTLEAISKSEESLAARLQNIESALFNALVPKKSKHYFTLFDAIYFDNILDRYDLETKIKEYFSSFGVRVAIK